MLFVLYSIPTFWAGLMLVLIFGKTQLDLLPILGLHDKDADPSQPLAYAWDTVLHCILPIATLTYGSLAYLSRQMRAGMLDVIRQDYIRTARAKGLSEREVVMKHALPSAILPLVSYVGPAMARVMTGSLVIERIFGLPGMGSYFVDGAITRDYTLVMGTVVVIAVFVVLFNLIVDILYAALDPRVRYD